MANRCHRGTKAPVPFPQECMATSSVGKSGQQNSGSQLEGRKRVKNAKYSIEFVILGCTTWFYLWWKPLEQHTAVQTRNAGLHVLLTSDIVFHHLWWHRHRKCWYTALQTWKFTDGKKPPIKALEKPRKFCWKTPPEVNLQSPPCLHSLFSHLCPLRLCCLTALSYSKTCWSNKALLIKAIFSAPER